MFRKDAPTRQWGGRMVAVVLLEVLKISVVSPDKEWNVGPVQPVSPLLKCLFYGQKLPVTRSSLRE